MGRSAATALANLGIRIFVADLDLEAARETVSNISGLQERGEAFHVDVSRSDSVTTLFQAIRKCVDRLDLLVNTAAMLGQTVFIEDLTDEEWLRMMAVNLDGMFLRLSRGGPLDEGAPDRPHRPFQLGGFPHPYPGGAPLQRFQGGGKYDGQDPGQGGCQAQHPGERGCTRVCGNTYVRWTTGWIFKVCRQKNSPAASW